MIDMIGKWIAYLRREQGISREELCRGLCSAGRLRRLETQEQWNIVCQGLCLTMDETLWKTVQEQPARRLDMRLLKGHYFSMLELKRKMKLVLMVLFIMFSLNSCGRMPQEASHVLEENSISSENMSNQKMIVNSEVENSQKEDDYEVLLQSFLIYLNHQAWYNPADFLQEAYSCAYNLYQEKAMNIVSGVTDFWLEIPSPQGTEWYHCNSNRQGYIFLADRNPPEKKDTILVQSGVLEIPEVLSPIFEMTAWKTKQIEKIMEEIELQCIKLFGWEMGLGFRVEVFLSDFDLMTGCMPILYFVCNEMVYQYTGNLLHDDFWMSESCNITFAYHYGSDIPVKKKVDEEKVARIRDAALFQLEFTDKSNVQEENLPEEVFYEGVIAPKSGELIERDVEHQKGIEMDFDGDGVVEQLYISGQMMYINGIMQRIKLENESEKILKYGIIDIDELDSRVNLILSCENGEYLAVYDGQLKPIAFFEGSKLSNACFLGNGRFLIEGLQINFPVCYRGDVIFCLTEEGECTFSSEWIYLKETYYFKLLGELRVEVIENEGIYGTELVLPQRLRLLATDGMGLMLFETEDGVQIQLSQKEITSGLLQLEEEVWLP